MRKYFFIAVLILVSAVNVVAQAPAQDTSKNRDHWVNTRAGNGFFRNKNFKQAEEKYRAALQTDSSKTVSSYNLGNSLYEQKKYEEAGKAYADALDSKNKDTLNRGWYNLGNSLYEQKKYSESVTAYKEALRNDPNDEDARYNLAMAQKQLKNQQQQSGDDGGESGDGQQQQQGNSGNNAQPKDPRQGQNDQDGKNNTSQQPLDPKKQGMSPDEAKKVMSALRDSEQKTRQRINQNGSGSLYKPSRDKDW